MPLRRAFREFFWRILWGRWWKSFFPKQRLRLRVLYIVSKERVSAPRGLDLVGRALDPQACPPELRPQTRVSAPLSLDLVARALDPQRFHKIALFRVLRGQGVTY